MPRPVTLEEIKAAHRKVALGVTNNPRLLPVFERLENEIAIRERETALLKRAHVVAHGQSATDETTS